MPCLGSFAYDIPGGGKFHSLKNAGYPALFKSETYVLNLFETMNSKKFRLPPFCRQLPLSPDTRTASQPLVSSFPPLDSQLLAARNNPLARWNWWTGLINAWWTGQWQCPCHVVYICQQRHCNK